MQHRPTMMQTTAFDAPSYEHHQYDAPSTVAATSMRSNSMYSLGSPSSPMPRSQQQQQRNGQQVIIDSAKFKTKLCRNYLMKVPCPFQDKCVFAHGDEQIRPMSNPTSPNTNRHDSDMMAFPSPKDSHNTSSESLAVPQPRTLQSRRQAQQQQQQGMISSPSASLPAPPSYEDFLQTETSPEDSSPATPTIRAMRFRYEPYSTHGIVFEN